MVNQKYSARRNDVSDFIAIFVENCGMYATYGSQRKRMWMSLQDNDLCNEQIFTTLYNKEPV